MPYLSTQFYVKVKTEPDPSHNQKINPWVTLKPYAKFHPILYMTFWVILITYKPMQTSTPNGFLLEPFSIFPAGFNEILNFEWQSNKQM